MPRKRVRVNTYQESQNGRYLQTRIAPGHPPRLLLPRRIRPPRTARAPLRPRPIVAIACCHWWPPTYSVEIEQLLPKGAVVRVGHSTIEKVTWWFGRMTEELWQSSGLTAKNMPTPTARGTSRSGSSMRTRRKAQTRTRIRLAPYTHHDLRPQTPSRRVGDPVTPRMGRWQNDRTSATGTRSLLHIEVTGDEISVRTFMRTNPCSTARNTQSPFLLSPTVSVYAVSTTKLCNRP
jgi:hypothetical protein